jgi:hypothetical protein
MSLQRAQCTPPARRLAGRLGLKQAAIQCGWLRRSLRGVAFPNQPIQESCASPSTLSSMLISFSSLDSKISRHSRHSTNSASSSRLTICTRGCLQGRLFALSGWVVDGFAVINPEASPSRNTGGIDSREFPGILAPRWRLSSPCLWISPASRQRGELEKPTCPQNCDQITRQALSR